MSRLSALVPLAVMVGFAWLIAFGLVAHRRGDADKLDKFGSGIDELADRMCACKDVACGERVQRDFRKISFDATPDSPAFHRLRDCYTRLQGIDP